MRIFLACLVLFSSTQVLANASGAIGYSGAPPNNSNCNGCHSGGGTPTVSFTGPSTLGAGATGTYTFTVSGGAGAGFGMNVSVSDPSAALNPVSSSLGVAFGELHQKARTSPGSFQFTLTAPPFAGTIKLYGTGNSVNGNGATSGDASASTSLTITVTGGSGQNAPVITTVASAISSPLKARTTTVSVVANDDGTEANLSYTWSSTGPAPVTFTPNGNNSAKTSTAEFSKQGDYVLTVIVRDGTNRTVTSTINLTVEATYTLLRMTPTAAQVALGGTLQYAVTARDQFDAPLPTQPPITYAVPAGGGTISATGLLHAQNAIGGDFIVQASSSPISTAATFAVGKAPGGASVEKIPPTVSLVNPSTAGESLDDGLVIEATAADNTGVAEVRFEVAQLPIGSVTSGPPWKLIYARVAGLPSGTQALEAIAKDIAGNETRSTSIPVQVPVTVVPDAGTGGGSGAGGGVGGGAAGGAAGGTAGGTGGGSDAGGGCSCNTAPLGFGILALLAAARRRRS